MSRERNSSFMKIKRQDSDNSLRLTIDGSNSIALGLKHRVSSFKQSKVRVKVTQQKENKNKLPSIFKPQNKLFNKILNNIQENVFFHQNLQNFKQNLEYQEELTLSHHKLIINKMLEKKNQILEQNSKKLQQNILLKRKVIQYNQSNQKIIEKIQQKSLVLKQKQTNYDELMQRNRKLKELALKLIGKKEQKVQLEKQYKDIRKYVVDGQTDFQEKIDRSILIVKFQFHKISLNIKKQPQIFEMPVYNDEYMILSYVRKITTPRLISCYLQIMKQVFIILINRKQNIYQIAKLRELVYLPIIAVYKQFEQTFFQMAQIQSKKKQEYQLFMQQRQFWNKQSKKLEKIYEETNLLEVSVKKQEQTKRAHKALELRNKIQSTMKLLDNLQDQYQMIEQK